MSNEDKILALLEKQGTQLEKLVTDVGILKSDVGTLKDDVKTLKVDVETLKDDMKTLNVDVETLKDDVVETKERIILMEQNNKQQHGALHDGFKLVYDKLKPVPPAVDNLQEDVSVIKSVVMSHSQDINILKVAT